MPVDGVAHRVPDAVRQVRACGPGRPCSCRARRGGVATACISMARAAGFRVYATARTEAKQAAALRARRARGVRVRRPAARAGRRGDGDRRRGHLVALAEVAQARAGASSSRGATSGPNPPADLNRIFFLQLAVVGSTMGTKAELGDLIAFLRTTGAAPAHRPHAAARPGRRRAGRDGLRRPGRQDRPRGLVATPAGPTGSGPVTAVVCAAFDPATDEAILAVARDRPDGRRASARPAAASAAFQSRCRPGRHEPTCHASSRSRAPLLRCTAPFPLRLGEVGRFGRAGVVWLGAVTVGPTAGVATRRRRGAAIGGLAARVRRAQRPRAVDRALHACDPRAQAAATRGPGRGPAGLRPIAATVDALATILVGGSGDVALRAARVALNSRARTGTSPRAPSSRRRCTSRLSSPTRDCRGSDSSTSETMWPSSSGSLVSEIVRCGTGSSPYSPP